MGVVFTTWRKSRRSGASGGDCVEVAFAANAAVGMRDSKAAAGPILMVTPPAWAAFLHALSSGSFDRPAR